MKVSCESKENTIVTNKKSRILWGVAFLFIAVLSVVAVVSFNKDFSFSFFVSYLKRANVFFLGCAVLCVFFFILFEGLSLQSIYSSFGYHLKKGSSFVYSAADIYFSAITPSASGGQPASAYFMLKDGISFPIVTISLVYTLLMYSVSIVAVVLISFLLSPTFFFQFDLLAKIIIGVGLLFQIGLIFIFYCLLYKEKLLYRICTWFLKILSKIHLLRSLDEKLNQLEEGIGKYQDAAQMLKGKRKVLFRVFFCNLLQRLCQIGVVVFVFLATNGPSMDVFSIFALQSFVITGAYAVPIPGAIGVTDYLMIQGFGKLLPLEAAVHLELVSRGLSFYFCIFVCGLVIGVRYFRLKRSSKHDRNL